MRRIILSLLCFLAMVSVAAACPVCDTPTGEQVRAGIFNDAFGENLLLTLAPFPLLILFVALLHYGIPGRRGRGISNTSRD